MAAVGRCGRWLLLFGPGLKSIHTSDSFWLPFYTMEGGSDTSTIVICYECSEWNATHIPGQWALAERRFHSGVTAGT